MLFRNLSLASVFFVSVASQATSLHPDTFKNKVAPQINSIKIAKVGSVGEIVKERYAHPYTTFLIAIPVQVNTESACTSFVGQTSKTRNYSQIGVTQISAFGATDPMVDACIEIYPAPIDTKMTVEMEVLTGGFVPAHGVQAKRVEFAGAGLYSVELDIDKNTVVVHPFKRF